MKQLFYLTALLCLASFTFSQPAASQSSFAGIHYQTVIRDSEGLPLQNTPVTLLMTIRTNTPDGQAAYSETHSSTTNLFGLVNLVIGQGTPVSGTFDAINWSAAPHFLETAIDAIGSGEFQVLGVTQFLSVPYALSSSNGVPGGNNPGDMLYWNGDTWIQVPAGQNGQVLTFSNGVPVWGGVQLPILNTSAVTNITAFTAYSGGTIASDGGSPVTTRGICWNNSPAPTIANFKITAGSGSGNFLAQMTGLESSTQYFVRAFATNSAGTSYGQEMTFYTTAGNITLSTTAVTNITITSASSGGIITLNGGSPVTARGVCWNTAAYPTTAHNKTTDGSGNGAYTSNLNGLAPNTQYYLRAYATNSMGTSYGNQLTFTTLSGIITLTTTGITGITDNSATSGGEITNDGGSAVTARGVCWNTSQNPTLANFKTTDGTGTGTFVSALTGLTEGTTFYVRAFATNAVGTYYGNQVSFVTLENLAPSAPNSPQPENGSNNVPINQILSWSCSDPESDPLTYDVLFGTENPPSQVATSIADTFYLPGTLYYVTTYYWKIVAHDDHGNSTDGEVWSFTTFEDIGCPQSFIDSRDGKNYSAIQIGNQCWMAENLDIGTKSSNYQTNNGIIEKFCYNNSDSLCNLYGGLYMWKETMGYTTTAGVQGICPDGWHLPFNTEWTALINFLGGENIAGGKMKEMGTSHWNSPNTGATNTVGFTGLPGGHQYSNIFGNLGFTGTFWSSSEYSNVFAWSLTLNYDKSIVFNNPNGKNYGFSVRCFKDTSSQINQNPLIPSFPIPETGSTNISINPTLSWSCSDPESDSLTYDVFFGTENPPTQIATAIADTFYTPGTLNYNTTYYWKIVAHDDHGNSTEGEIWSFTTMDEPWQCGDVLIDERDGQEYNTLQIGEQCWMAENLNVGTRIDGGLNQQNNGIVEKYCYDNLETNCDVYGGLYQWDEAMGFTTNIVVQGVCPDEWHLPTDYEWLVLTTFLGGENNCGGKLKSTGTREALTGLWYSPNTGATNSSNFSGFPGGNRSTTSGDFDSLGGLGLWWSTNESSSTNAWARKLSYENSIAYRGSSNKTYAFSIRCLKN